MLQTMKPSTSNDATIRKQTLFRSLRAKPIASSQQRRHLPSTSLRKWSMAGAQGIGAAQPEEDFCEGHPPVLARKAPRMEAVLVFHQKAVVCGHVRGVGAN